MKTDKKKIVFGGIILLVLGFIGVYAFWMYGGDAANRALVDRISIPELEQQISEYESRMEAVNDLKDERKSNAPSVYQEVDLDSLETEAQELEKQELIDSLLGSSWLEEVPEDYLTTPETPAIKIDSFDTKPNVVPEMDLAIMSKELGLNQQLFFTSNPKLKSEEVTSTNELHIVVSGTQTVRANDRLQLRTTKATVWNGIRIPAHTLLYASVSFQPNRVLLEVVSIDGIPVKLKAYDIQDGREGIFVKNSYQQEARREVVEDVVNDIKLPGVPQIRGLKNVFRRSNRQVKVTVFDNYQLLLNSTK